MAWTGNSTTPPSSLCLSRSQSLSCSVRVHVIRVRLILQCRNVVWSALEMPKPDFHTVELNKTEWEVPKRYSMLSPVGSGAYGQVWWVAPLSCSLHIFHLTAPRLHFGFHWFFLMYLPFHLLFLFSTLHHLCSSPFLGTSLYGHVWWVALLSCSLHIFLLTAPLLYFGLHLFFLLYLPFHLLFLLWILHQLCSSPLLGTSMYPACSLRTLLPLPSSRVLITSLPCSYLSFSHLLFRLLFLLSSHLFLFTYSFFSTSLNRASHFSQHLCCTCLALPPLYLLAHLPHSSLRIFSFVLLLIASLFFHSYSVCYLSLVFHPLINLYFLVSLSAYVSSAYMCHVFCSHVCFFPFVMKL